MRFSYYVRPLIMLTASLFLLLVSTQAAFATEISFSDDIPVQPTDWSGTLELPAFNPALGQLQSVELILEGFVQGSVSFENTGPNTATITTTHAVTIELQLLDASRLITTPAASRVSVMPGYDGVTDYAGPSGRTDILSATETITRLLTAPADLAAYSGVGVLQFPTTATGDSRVVGPGNLSALLEAQASSAVLTIIYIYEGPGIEIQKMTNDADADDPNGSDVPLLSPGETVTWTYLVTNTGNISFPVASVVVTDSHASVIPLLDPSSDIGSDGILSPQEVWLYRATGQAENLQAPGIGVEVVDGCNPSGAQVPGARPTYRNIGRVTIPQLSAEDPSHYCNPQPGIVLQKLTNEADADDPNGSDVPHLAPGQTVTWTYIVTNTGDVSFAQNSVIVTDSHQSVTPVLDPTSDDGADGILSAGESWLFRATGQAASLETPPADITVVDGCNPAGTQTPGPRNAYRNIGRVTVPGATAADPSHYCNLQPGIALQKLTNEADADEPNDPDVPRVAPGQSVTWTYIVTNTGDLPFNQSSVIVTDSHQSVIPLLDPSSDSGADGVLSPGESWLFRATGQAATLATPGPDITVVDGCNPAGTQTPGPRNTYRNIGRVTVPGATATDPSHYCNPQPGIVLQKFTNDADADDPNGTDVPQVAPGQTVIWTYIVTNTGDVPFNQSSVIVTDSHQNITPQLDTTSDNGADGILSPGESWRFRATGQAATLTTPSADITVVDGCNPAATQAPGPRNTYRNIGHVAVPGATAEDPSHYCNPLDPGIVLKKFTNSADADNPNGPDVPQIVPGQPITWTYIITNTGDVSYPVAAITVTDSHTGVVPVRDVTSDIGNDGILAPGESWIYRAHGVAEDLRFPSSNVTIIPGCNPNNTTHPDFQQAYRNIGRVSTPNGDAEDPSHYCNVPPTALETSDEPDAGRPSSNAVFIPYVKR